MTRRALPDFLLIGAPKAGTTALHAALATHDQLYLAPVKEPKYFLCGGRPPDRAGQRGPGDAHSAKEWVWRTEDYERLFTGAPAGTLRGESTPFYLSDPRAHERIHASVPHARLIVVIRDPVDRAYSNWMHLWSDGLEPEADFARAFDAEDERRAAGWAPFWRYRSLGLYGEQLAQLYTRFARDQVHVVRYRQLVDSPVETIDAVCRFLDVRTGAVTTSATQNSRPFVENTARTRLLARAARAGAAGGRFFPPQVWRRAGRPLTRALQRGDAARPVLAAEIRQRLAAVFAADIALLERLTGDTYQDWLSDRGRGSFLDRRPAQTT
jgi:hypothetical protein